MIWDMKALMWMNWTVFANADFVRFMILVGTRSDRTLYLGTVSRNKRWCVACKLELRRRRRLEA